MTKAAIKSALPETISVVDAADLLGVSDQWVRDLGKRGFIPGLSRGRAPLKAAVQGYIRWLKDEERRTSKTASASAVQEERAREIRLRNAKEEGRLIELAEAEAVFADILGTFRSALSGVSAAATRDLTLRHSIDAAINHALDRAREGFEEKRDVLRAGGDIILDDEETAA